MEYQIAYSELSQEARYAWETVSGLPLATPEQQRHAWDVLRSEFTCLAGDPQPGLHVITSGSAAAGELYINGPELGALRVMVAWLKANDRAGRMRDLPIYPDLAEVIISQLGPMPWPGVWHPCYLSQLAYGGTLVLQPQSQAVALARLLDFTLEHGTSLCPGWSVLERVYLLSLLADLRCWLQALLAVHDHETAS